MPFSLYTKLIDEIEGKVSSVKLNYRGEPLLYNELTSAIAYAKDAGLRVMINSNGILLDERTVLALQEAGLDLFLLSDYGHDIQLDNGLLLSLTDIELKVKTDSPEHWEGITDEPVPFTLFDYGDLKEDFTKSSFKCSIPFERLLVLADGTISKCSCGYWHPIKKLGNFPSMSIRGAWNHVEMKFLRTCHEHGDSHLLRMCRMCAVRRGHDE